MKNIDYSGFVMLKLENPRFHELQLEVQNTTPLDFKFETDCHVTIGLFIENIRIGDVLKTIWSSIPFGAAIKADEVSSQFMNPDMSVVKFNSTYSTLYRLNSICQSFPNNNPRPKYNPHITFAYLPVNTEFKTRLANPFFVVCGVMVSYTDNLENLHSMHIAPDKTFSMSVTDKDGKPVQGSAWDGDAFSNLK